MLRKLLKTALTSSKKNTDNNVSGVAKVIPETPTRRPEVKVQPETKYYVIKAYRQTSKGTKIEINIEVLKSKVFKDTANGIKSMAVGFLFGLIGHYKTPLVQVYRADKFGRVKSQFYSVNENTWWDYQD